jgi:hypothetical protein
MNMAVFSFVAPCSLVEAYRRFRGACYLHHQGDLRSKHFWKVGKLLPDCTALKSRRQPSSMRFWFSNKTIISCHFLQAYINSRYTSLDGEKAKQLLNALFVTRYSRLVAVLQLIAHDSYNGNYAIVLARKETSVFVKYQKYTVYV